MDDQEDAAYIRARQAAQEFHEKAKALFKKANEDERRHFAEMEEEGNKLRERATQLEDKLKTATELLHALEARHKELLARVEKLEGNP